MDAIERRKQACEQAAEWFVRLQAHDVPRAAREEYIDWLRDSPTHVAEMLRIARVHGSLEQFERWARVGGEAGEAASNVVPLEVRRSMEWETGASRSGGKAWRFAVAAAVVLVAAIAVFRLGIEGQAIDTERGERREVVLSDGSVVQVDPQTRLRVKFTDEARLVELERGRALFHVAKNPGRPFLVRADATTIRAVGTAFGVERERQGIVVTVSEGRVAVQGSAERAGEALLSAGQQLIVQGSGSTEPLRKVDTARELAWAEGRLVFENESVTRAIEEFNRYNRVQLRVTDEALASRPVSGVFSASDPESFIAFIQAVTPVRVIRSGDEAITLSPTS
jgi:transmembrane sensor